MMMSWLKGQGEFVGSTDIHPLTSIRRDLFNDSDDDGGAGLEDLGCVMSCR
jgi:hypothetical protein